MRAPDWSQRLFVPWLDDCLVEGESCYSVLNKVVWFAGCTVATYLATCREEDGVTLKTVRSFSFDSPGWEERLVNSRVQPVVQGKLLVDNLRDREEFERALVPEAWRSRELRVCPLCIEMGVHLALHMHLAVAKCPLHNSELGIACIHCGETMHQNLSLGQQAFSCPRCKHSMLESEKVVTHHPARIRQLAHKALADFSAWVAVSGLDRPMELGQSLIQVPNEPEPELQSCTGPRVLLEARSRAVAPPDWIKRSELAGACVQVRKIRIVTPNRPCDATSQPVIETPQPASQPELSSVDPDRLSASLRRVASMFLHRWQPTHPRCIDTPVQLEQTYHLDSSGFSDLVRCCPVAVGFWMWRHAASRQFRVADMKLSHQDVCAADLDRLLFCVARSHLHYCLYAACRVWAAPGDDRKSADEAFIRGILYHSCWSPSIEVSANGAACYLIRAGEAEYVRFSADALIQSIRCPGPKPYLDNLRKRTAAVMGLPKDSKIDPVWVNAGYSQRVPFLRMKDDLVFVDDAMHPKKTPSKWPNLYSPADRRRTFAVIDSAIESKVDG